MGNPNWYLMIIAVAFFLSSQSPRGTVKHHLIYFLFSRLWWQNWVLNIGFFFNCAKQRSVKKYYQVIHHYLIYKFRHHWMGGCDDMSRTLNLKTYVKFEFNLVFKNLFQMLIPLATKKFWNSGKPIGSVDHTPLADAIMWVFITCFHESWIV